MIERPDEFPSDDRKEENSAPKAKDVIVPAGMLMALSACGGGGGTGSAAGGSSTGNDPATTPTLPTPADGRVTIDPVTRIEGHLRLETEIKDG